MASGFIIDFNKFVKRFDGQDFLVSTSGGEPKKILLKEVAAEILWHFSADHPIDVSGLVKVNHLGRKILNSQSSIRLTGEEMFLLGHFAAHFPNVYMASELAVELSDQSQPWSDES